MCPRVNIRPRTRAAARWPVRSREAGEIMTSKVAVLGAGFAGLSAACHLAAQGHDVTLVDRHDQAGGRARVWTQDGYRFDMGPSWYWMPDVFERFFRRFGHEDLEAPEVPDPRARPPAQ